MSAKLLSQVWNLTLLWWQKWFYEWKYKSFFFILPIIMIKVLVEIFSFVMLHELILLIRYPLSIIISTLLVYSCCHLYISAFWKKKYNNKIKCKRSKSRFKWIGLRLITFQSILCRYVLFKLPLNNLPYNYWNTEVYFLKNHIWYEKILRYFEDEYKSSATHSYSKKNSANLD